jgi:predicted nucleic acid-binding protein
VIAYLDTSALLRLVLREPGALEELRSCEAMVASELIAVESLRTIDRLRLQGVEERTLFGSITFIVRERARSRIDTELTEWYSRCGWDERATRGSA